MFELEWLIGDVGTVTTDENGNILSGNGFAKHGINIDGGRRSLDGSKAIIHSNKLTANQKNGIRGDETFMYLDGTSTPTIDEVLATKEWTDEVSD